MASTGVVMARLRSAPGGQPTRDSAAQSSGAPLKACKVCRGYFPALSSLQQTCRDPVCAKEWRRQRERKKALRQARAAKREYRARTKTIPKLIKEAQKEFNHFIRERDLGRPCISCGKLPGVSGLYQGHHVVDCGHYRSTGAAPHLRFHEDNAHAQCVNCNRDKSGNAVEYRILLVARIGGARVEALENDNGTVKWDRAELVQIRRTYLAKWKKLRAARESLPSRS